MKKTNDIDRRIHTGDKHYNIAHTITKFTLRAELTNVTSSG